MAADVGADRSARRKAGACWRNPRRSPLSGRAFRENRGAVFGLGVVAGDRADRHFRRCPRAAFADRAVPRGGARQASVGGRRLVALPARHRRRRARHAVAAHLRRARVAVHRRLRHGVSFVIGVGARAARRDGGPIARRRHHPRDGPHDGGAEPRAGDPGRRDPRAEPDEHDRRRHHRLPAALRAAGARLRDRRTRQGLCDGGARRPASGRCGWR